MYIYIMHKNAKNSYKNVNYKFSVKFPKIYTLYAFVQMHF